MKNQIKVGDLVRIKKSELRGSSTNWALHAAEHRTPFLVVDIEQMPIKTLWKATLQGDLYDNEVKGPFVYLHTYMLTKRGL